VLQIESVVTSDQGTYRCVATNDARERRSNEAQLVVTPATTDDGQLCLVFWVRGYRVTDLGWVMVSMCDSLHQIDHASQACNPRRSTSSVAWVEPRPDPTGWLLSFDPNRSLNVLTQCLDIKPVVIGKR